MVICANSRAVVNNDEAAGTARDPWEWSADALPKRRRVVHAVRNDALLLGPGLIWESGWIGGFFPPLFLRRMCVVGLTLWVYCQVGCFLKYSPLASCWR